MLAISLLAFGEHTQNCAFKSACLAVEVSMNLLLFHKIPLLFFLKTPELWSFGIV
jgi:hypothetical protein